MLKTPTLVDIDEELTKEFTDELPTLIVDVAVIRLATPLTVTAVLFAIKLDPTV